MTLYDSDWIKLNGFIIHHFKTYLFLSTYICLCLYMDHNVSAVYVSIVSIGILIDRVFALMVI